MVTVPKELDTHLNAGNWIFFGLLTGIAPRSGSASSLYAGMSPVLTWTSSNPPGKLPVRGDEPAELRYHLSIMAQPSLYVGMDFILEFYA